MEHKMAYLDGVFVSKQKISLKKYKQIMEHKFFVELDGSSQYTKLKIFEGFSEWFECKIYDLATNLLQWFDVVYLQKDKAWTTKVANLWEKISWWVKFSKNRLKKKAKLTPWMEEGARNLLAQI